MPTNISINATTDGYQNGGALYPGTSKTTLKCGTASSGYSIWTIFSGITIPQSSTINTARFLFSAGKTSATNPKVYAIGVDRGGVSPAAPTHYNQISGAQTDTTIAGTATITAASFGPGSFDYSGVKLIDHVQALVNNNGYSNDKMMFFVRSSTTASSTLVSFYHQGGGAGGDWQIQITYTLPPPVDKTTYVFI